VALGEALDDVFRTETVQDLKTGKAKRVVKRVDERYTR